MKSRVPERSRAQTHEARALWLASNADESSCLDLDPHLSRTTMLLEPLDSEGSSGSRARKIFIPANDLKAEGIIAGDLVRVSVQGSQQVRLAKWSPCRPRPLPVADCRSGPVRTRRRISSSRPGPQIRFRAKVRSGSIARPRLLLTLACACPGPVGLLSPSHYASLQLPLPLEDGSSTSAPSPKIDVRKVNVAKLSPKEARAVKLVEVASVSEPSASEAGGTQEDMPSNEPKREDEWLEICLKQALGMF